MRPLSLALPQAQQATQKPLFGVIAASSPLCFAGTNSDVFESQWPNQWAVEVTGPLADQIKPHVPALLKQAQKANTQARRGQTLDGMGHSGKHYGAFVELENGVTAVATNIDLATGENVCDLRSATVMAVNKALAQGKVQGLTVKQSVLVNADLHGGKPNPCSDCQRVMTGEHFTPDSVVASLAATDNTEGKPYTLNVRRVSDMLGLSTGNASEDVPVTDRVLETLSPAVSESAQAVMERDWIGQHRLLELLEAAQAQYDKNASSEYSGKRTGAALWMTSPETNRDGVVET